MSLLRRLVIRTLLSSCMFLLLESCAHVATPPPLPEASLSAPPTVIQEVVRPMELPRPWVDSDGDGVDDEHDMCPNTPRGVLVYANGCPVKSSATGSAVPKTLVQHKALGGALVAPVSVMKPAPILPQAQHEAEPPAYAYRLSSEIIQSSHETVLSVGVSMDDVEKLVAMLAAHQAGSKPVKDAVPSTEQQQKPIAESGQLITRSWTSFQYIRAEIRHCPAFLTCDADSVLRHIDGGPMIWDFVLAVKDSSKTQDGAIIVNFTGAVSPDGPFIEIASLPGLVARVNVMRDATWWEQKMNGWQGVLKAMHGLLEALGAVIVLLWSWRGLMRLRTAKADVSPVPPLPAGGA